MNRSLKKSTIRIKSEKNKRNWLLVRLFYKCNKLAKTRLRQKVKRTNLVFGALRKTLSLVFMIGLLVCVFIVLLGKLKIKEIVCFEAGVQCREFINKKFTSALGLGPNKSIEKIKNTIIEDNLSEKYIVKYSFPYKVLVNLNRREPFVALTNVSGWSVLLDTEGVAVDIVENTDLISIESNYPMPNMGEKANESVLSGALLVGRLNKITEIEKAVLSANKLEVKIKNDSTLYIFPTQGDVDYLSGAFALTLSRLNNPNKEFTMEKSRITEIDFRYANPVIRAGFSDSEN